jgi:flagellar biosynthesis protein FlhF
MKIRRFVAKDMRTALAQIKEELGVDAVIMSNKKVPEGVEIMAAVDYSQVTPEAKPKINAALAQNNSPDIPSEIANDLVTLNHSLNTNNIGVNGDNTHMTNNDKAQVPADSLSALLNRQVQHEPTLSAKENNASSDQSIGQQFKTFTQRLQNPADEENLNSELSGDNDFAPEISVKKESEVNINDNENKLGSVDLQSMQEEMAAIRKLLEHQVSGLMWQDLAQKDPQRAVLVDRLIALGLTEQIADQIAGYVPQRESQEDGWHHAKKLIAQQLNTTNNDIINRGGVVALIGPTGVGKTTTIAKLAARFAQYHGADQIALISTDTFRIAGFEQLNTYGKIIGCNVKLAKDAEELDVLLQLFSNKKLILIDTAGMGQRDIRLAEHLTTLVMNTRVKIRNYLVLAANTQQRVMQENVERFKKVPLSGVIYTKLDESLSIGEIISTSIQNGLPIGYLTDGQRVPEDIKVANVDKLVTLADKMVNHLPAQQAVSVRSVPKNNAEVLSL